MRRVMIMGPCGSGKSTLARRIGARHALPVFHLDQAFHRPGWKPAPEAEFVAEVNRVPEHRRGEEGVVPGWSVNDLVFHNGRWAGVAAEKLGLIRDTGSAGEDDPDEVWRGKNDLWAAESKSMLYQEAMSRALADRDLAARDFL